MGYQVDYNIDLIRKGNKAEFERIYFDFFDVLFALGLQYTSDQSVAESIVQDAFMKLWEVRKKLLSQTNIRNFLYTITKNLCLNHLRNQKNVWKHLNQVKSHEYDYGIESLSQLGDTYLEFEELNAKVDQAIENLSEKLKVVFKMSRIDELKYREIAEQLQISEKTVESRITRALKILRTELKDYLSVLFVLSNFFS